MKRKHLTIAIALTLAASMTLTSCIGSFSLTRKVLNWNNHVGNKFINELVFVAFWVLPVYEVTALGDLLVLNSIEFWSGNNPVEIGMKKIDTDSGRYLVECDGKGYTITSENTGESCRLDFDDESRTWSLQTEEGELPFMTFVDDTHVALPSPDGTSTVVETSREGVMAYRAELSAPFMALSDR